MRGRFCLYFNEQKRHVYSLNRRINYTIILLWIRRWRTISKITVQFTTCVLDELVEGVERFNNTASKVRVKYKRKHLMVTSVLFLLGTKARLLLERSILCYLSDYYRTKDFRSIYSNIRLLVNRIINQCRHIPNKPVSV